MEPLKINGADWYVIPVNPEPWAIGPVSVGRRNGKMFPIVGRNQQLDAYKQAIAEELGDGHELIEGKVKLKFFFWRQRAEYTTPQGRAHRKHEADLTNLQKATEDALQGVLFVNDKEVNEVHSVMAAQGPDVVGRVVLSIRPANDEPYVQLPDFVQQRFNLLDAPVQPVQDDNSWPPKGAF